MNENTDIFIYSHKKFTPIVTNPVYKILTNCHDEFTDTNLPVYRDYEGEDNIADKNLMYNEYTGFYWLWKNYPLKKYIGLNHYRRYYFFKDNVPDLEKIFDNFEIVLNRPIYFLENQFVINFDKDVKVWDNRSWYNFWHNVEDFDKLEQLFNEQFPEYLDGFYKMKNAGYIYNCSLFLMKSEIFKEYCEYVFTVLDAYNKMFGCETVDAYIKHVEANQDKYIKAHLPYYTIEIQARITGYIAERVLNAYLMNGENSLEKHSIQFPWIQL